MVDVGVRCFQRGLRPGDTGLAGLDLAADPGNRALLRRQPVLRRLQGQTVIAVVDPRDHVTGAHLLVVDDLNGGT